MHKSCFLCRKRSAEEMFLTFFLSEIWLYQIKYIPLQSQMNIAGWSSW